jgi:hypothetical protein
MLAGGAAGGASAAALCCSCDATMFKELGSTAGTANCGCGLRSPLETAGAPPAAAAADMAPDDGMKGMG